MGLDEQSLVAGSMDLLLPPASPFDSATCSPRPLPLPGQFFQVAVLEQF